MLHSGESRGETMSLVHMAASVSLAYSQSDAVMVCGINSWSLLLDSQALFLAPGEESHTSKPETRCINIGLLGIGRQEEGRQCSCYVAERFRNKPGEFSCSKRVPRKGRAVQGEDKKWEKKTRAGLFSKSVFIYSFNRYWPNIQDMPASVPYIWKTSMRHTKSSVSTVTVFLGRKKNNNKQK